MNKTGSFDWVSLGRRIKTKSQGGPELLRKGKRKIMVKWETHCKANLGDVVNPWNWYLEPLGEGTPLE